MFSRPVFVTLKYKYSELTTHRHCSYCEGFFGPGSVFGPKEIALLEAEAFLTTKDVPENLVTK